MAEYHCVSVWQIKAPIERVWAEISRAERWPDWWKYVVGVAELEGTGHWTLTVADGGTLVRYTWDIRTTKWWMNLLAPVARPTFNWNHDQLMREGARAWPGGLARSWRCRRRSRAAAR